MAEQAKFPATLFVQAGSRHDDGSGRDYFGKASIDQMNDGDGASDGEEIAVYQLLSVKRVEVTRTLIDTAT